MSDLYRFGLKIFLDDGEDLPLNEFVPLFHRWIQTAALDGLWIDVADYSHVPRGPGVLLIGHEANLGLDETGGRRGLLVSWKQPLEGTLAQRLLLASRVLLRAAHRLEEEPNLAVRFRTNELEIVFNDRLRAPNDEDTFSRLRPEIEAFLTEIFGPSPLSLERERDLRERLTVRARVSRVEGRLLSQVGP